MRMRRLAVSLLATATLAGLAGCSDKAVDDQSTDTGGATSPDTPAILSQESFADDIVAAQSAAGSAHLTATIEAAGTTLDLTGDVAGLGTPDALKMDVLVSFQDQEIRLLRVGRVLYLQGRQFAPKGKEWLGIDLSDPGNPLGQIFEAANPGNFTAYLQGVTKFDESGLETVDGVETRHYTITVDTAKMLRSNPMFRGQDAATLGLPPELTTEVYVDDENRPVAMLADLGATGRFDVHFSDYGKDVRVTAPDPSTVGEFSL